VNEASAARQRDHRFAPVHGTSVLRLMSSRDVDVCAYTIERLNRTRSRRVRERHAAPSCRAIQDNAATVDARVLQEGRRWSATSQFSRGNRIHHDKGDIMRLWREACAFFAQP